jgi:hypothetical protein
MLRINGNWISLYCLYCTGRAGDTATVTLLWNVTKTYNIVQYDAP